MTLFVSLAALLVAQASPHPNNANAQAHAASPSAGGPATPIGMAITLDHAKRVAAAAAAEARKNGWFMAVAVVDPGGTLIYYEKADNTQMGSAVVAVDKAKSAALYKRPTKAFQDAIAKGGEGLRVLGLAGAIPVDGGQPLIVDGKLIGGLGVSGDTSEHDNQCAMQGVAALTAK
jgi:glc operon protein GlcG